MKKETKENPAVKRLQAIEKEIAELSGERDELKAHWILEKELISEIRSMKEQLENLKTEAENYEREGDLGKVAEIRYGRIVELQKNIEEKSQKLNTLQKDKKMLKEEVDSEDIAEIVAKWTGIPVTRMLESEREKLLHVEENLHKRVIGQDEAISAVANAIRRSRAGLQDAARPIGSFIFLGTTGVGKTELAKALAEFLFDDEHNIVRIDMSEYMEKFSVSRLIGAPPGYVGYEEGGQLTEAVRRKPYSVVLLDEIEKAHPDVFNILLQVLDDGQLTDSQGRRVDFKNTIVIMTSNVGTKDIKKQARIGFGESSGGDEHLKMKEQVDESMKRLFNPEFLNRIDDTIVFRHLEKEDIKLIITISMTKLLKRVHEMGVDVQLTDGALDFLAEKGFDKAFGARPLKRAMQK